MQLRAYLKDSAREDNGFSELKKDSQYEWNREYRINPFLMAIKLSSSGKLYVEIGSMHEKLNSDLIRYVDYLECVMSEPLFSRRRAYGIYEHLDAQAEFSTTYTWGSKSPSLTIKGPTIESVRDIYVAIASGAIKPIHNFESNQDGFSEQVKANILERLQARSQPTKESVGKRLMQLLRKKDDLSNEQDIMLADATAAYERGTYEEADELLKKLNC